MGQALSSIAHPQLGPPLEQLVAFVSDGSEREQIDAAEKLGVIAQDKFKAREIVRNGGVRPLIRMLTRGNDEGKKRAAKALREVARNKAHQVVISQACGIPPLVELLETRTPEDVQEEVAACLGAVAANAQVQAAIGESGVIPLLVRRLELAGPVLKERLVALIWNLAYDENNRVALREAGVIPVLIRYLGPDYNNRKALSRVLEVAVGALKILAENDENKVCIVKEQGIEKLTWLLRNKGTSDSRMRCIDTLGRLGELQESTMIFAEREVIEAMLTLNDDMNNRMLYAIANALELIAWSDENRRMIIAAGGVRTLSHMLQRGPQELKAKAASALYLLASRPEGREAMTKDSAIESLIKDMYSHSEAVQLEGMRCLEAALRWPRNQKLFFRHQGLLPAIDMLSLSLSKAGKAKAAGILQCVAAMPSNIPEIIRLGGIKPLADLLEEGNMEAQVKALGALSSIALDPKYHIHLYRAGALVLLVPWIDRGNFDGRAAATNAIALLAKEALYCKEMMDAGALPKLTALVCAEGGTNESNAAACKAIGAVAMTTGCREEIAKAGIIPGVVTLLKEAELEVKKEAAVCLWSLALHDVCRSFIEKEGGVAALVKVLEIHIDKPEKLDDDSESDEDFDDDDEDADTASTDTDPVEIEYKENYTVLMAAKANCAGSLATLALSPEGRIAIGRAGGVKALTRLLVEGSNKARAKAAGALSNLAADPNLRVEIGEVGAILPLVRLLDLNSDLESRAKAKGALWNLALDAGNRHAIASAGAIRPLVVLMHRGDDEPKAKTAGTLWNLAVSAENQVAIVKAGAVRPLVDLLVNTFLEDARVCSAGALWNLALTAEGRTEIRNCNGVDALLGVVRRCSGVAQATAAGALRNLMADPRSCATISSAGTLPGLDQSGKTSGIEARLVRMSPS
mmetsp:Transcript_39071/g.71157  ORF Transcript_39071/g.71157 Transcript_39071/m.71157 type:complete len:917 (-) Transcript_39071:72-2822(-)